MSCALAQVDNRRAHFPCRKVLKRTVIADRTYHLVATSRASWSLGFLHIRASMMGLAIRVGISKVNAAATLWPQQANAHPPPPGKTKFPSGYDNRRENMRRAVIHPNKRYADPAPNFEMRLLPNSTSAAAASQAPPPNHCNRGQEGGPLKFRPTPGKVLSVMAMSVVVAPFHRRCRTA